MTEEALKELSLPNLIGDCINTMQQHPGTKEAYKAYIFYKLLEDTYDRYIEDYIIDYKLFIDGELEEIIWK